MCHGPAACASRSVKESLEDVPPTRRNTMLPDRPIPRTGASFLEAMATVVAGSSTTSDRCIYSVLLRYWNRSPSDMTTSSSGSALLPPFRDRQLTDVDQIAPPFPSTKTHIIRQSSRSAHIIG